MADYNVSNFEQGMSGLNQDYLNLKSRYDTRAQNIQGQTVSENSITNLAKKNIVSKYGLNYDQVMQRLNSLSSFLSSGNYNAANGTIGTLPFEVSKLGDYNVLKSIVYKAANQSTATPTSTTPQQLTPEQQNAEFKKAMIDKLNALRGSGAIGSVEYDRRLAIINSQGV